MIATRNNQIIISGQTTSIKRVQTWVKCRDAFNRITKKNNLNLGNKD